ncbi:alpha/beta hydrolase [Nostoc sp. 3335mG]|nr:alpha/beta hydrolase [Nostoc sp. 3335mG]
MSFPFVARLAALAMVPVLLAHGTAAHAEATAERISVTVTGKGPDVILIPGLASSAHVWDGTVAALSPHYRVHVVQVAGFAGMAASANASGPVMAPTIEAIHAYIAASHLKSPAVIGHSLGGLMAMKLAIDHPADVGRLMIVDSLPFYGMMMGPRATVAQAEPQAATMRDRLLKGSQQDYAAFEPIVMRKLVKSDGPAAQAATAAAAASDHRVVAEAMYDDFTTDLRPDLAKITQPVTMLYPWDAATGMPQAAFDQLYTGAYAPLKQAKVQRIDDSFHFIMIDQPAAFETAVEAFLKN